MFAEHEGLNGIRIHVGLFYNLGNQSGGIQSGAGAQHAAFWEAKAFGDLSGNDVAWVADVENHAVETGFANAVHPGVNGGNRELQLSGPIVGSQEQLNVTGAVND